MSKNYYLSGENNLICDSCGKKIKLHEARVRWDGLLVCQADYEERQPQDFVRARQDKITVPLVRPRPTDIFVDGVNCNIYTRSSIADIGTADCASVDFIGEYVCRIFDAKPKDLEESSFVGYAVVGESVIGFGDVTSTVCAPSYFELDNKTSAFAMIAISGYAVSGLGASLSPNI